jgi:hypothetical protein
MTTRAIVTVSVESADGAGSRTYSRANTMLQGAGFHPQGMSTWECSEGDPKVLLRALERLAKLLQGDDAARINHLWVYFG